MSVQESVPTRAMTAAEASSKLDGLNLQMVRMKLADHKEGKGWSDEQLDLYEREYRRFLALNLMYPLEAIVPSQDVDAFWHAHILDTAAYRVDCERIFGQFFDHYPYFGMRDEADAAALDSAYDLTLALYEENFGDVARSAWLGAEGGKCRTGCKPQKCRGSH